MTSRAAAARYARALFDVALKERVDLRGVQRELSSFAALVAEHADLSRALSNPAIPAAKKRGVVEELLRHAGDVSPVLARLLLLLADRDRLVLLGDVASAYDSRLMDHEQVVRAEVVTAVPLPDDRVTELRAGLGRATGRDVHLQTRVDPSIVGGAVARIGSTVFDGSITRQLARLKESLLSAAE